MKSSLVIKDLFRNNKAICLFALICCALWGSAFSCIKIGYELFRVGASDISSQLLFAGCRFTLAGILVIIFESIRDHSIIKPTRKSLPKVMTLALFQTVLQYTFFYMGLSHIVGVKASIINGTSNVFAVLLAIYMFRIEKMSILKALGCLCGLSGLVLVNLQDATLDLGFTFTGEGFMIISAVAAAVSTVLIRIFSKNENPVMLSGYQFFSGGIILIIIALIMGGSLHPVSFKAYILLLYMALISSVAYSLWGILLKYNPVSKITVYGFMTPVFGVILSAILLKEYEQLNYTCLSSLLLVCLGIFLTNKAVTIESDSEAKMPH